MKTKDLIKDVVMDRSGPAFCVLLLCGVLVRLAVGLFSYSGANELSFDMALIHTCTDLQQLLTAAQASVAELLSSGRFSAAANSLQVPGIHLDMVTMRLNDIGWRLQSTHQCLYGATGSATSL